MSFLYNLANDLGERNDLARQHTDIVRRLFSLIGQWEQDVDTEARALAAKPSVRVRRYGKPNA